MRAQNFDAFAFVSFASLFPGGLSLASPAQHHSSARSVRVVPLVEVKQKEPLPPRFLVAITNELRVSLGLSGFTVVNGTKNGNGKSPAGALETWRGRLSVQKKVYAPGWVYRIELEQHASDGQLIRAGEKYAEIYTTDTGSERCPDVERARFLMCGVNHLRFITRWLVRRMLAPPQGPPRNTAPIDVGVPPRDEPGMVFVPGGEFVMGSEFGEFDEDPRHVVSLGAFYIDKTEVTNAKYRRCVAARKCRASLADRNPHLGGAAQPVVSVSWHDARNYCAFVGKRLPTEAEWEKAARGTDERKWPWGNEWKRECVNTRDAVDGYKYTSPVGSFSCGASPYGALDMAGNAWEWCEDWWAPDTYGASQTGGVRPPCPSGCAPLARHQVHLGYGRVSQALCSRGSSDPFRSRQAGVEFGRRFVALPISAARPDPLGRPQIAAEIATGFSADCSRNNEPRKNPKGPASSPRGRRIMRGGTWKYEVAFFVTTTNRSHTYPANRVPWVGFRCAK